MLIYICEVAGLNETRFQHTSTHIRQIWVSIMLCNVAIIHTSQFSSPISERQVKKEKILKN